MARVVRPVKQQEGQDVFTDTPHGRTDLHVWGPILSEDGDEQHTFNLRDPKAVAKRLAERAKRER